MRALRPRRTGRSSDAQRPQCRGRGGRGVRSAGWDTEGNIRLEIICSAELAERIAAHLQQRYYANYAMVCYLSSVQVLRPDKF